MLEKESHVIWKKKKKRKKWISLLHLNEFNVKDGFENNIVVKIFYASSNDKKVWKKKKTQFNMLYIYIYIYILLHYSKINKNKKITKKCHIIEI